MTENNVEVAEESWFSDRAIAKLAEVDRKKAAGEKVSILDLAGIMEPRTQPEEHERCRYCGSDAREGGGGDGRYCGLCIGRGRAEEDRYVPYAETPGGRADRKTLAIEALDRELATVWVDGDWTEEQEQAARVMRSAIRGAVMVALRRDFDLALTTTAPSTRGAGA